jgi:hypothetical protein
MAVSSLLCWIADIVLHQDVAATTSASVLLAGMLLLPSLAGPVNQLQVAKQLLKWLAACSKGCSQRGCHEHTGILHHLQIFIFRSLSSKLNQFGFCDYYQLLI